MKPLRSWISLFLTGAVFLTTAVVIGVTTASAAVTPTWTDQEIGAALNLGGGGAVTSVSCVSANFCVAGGDYKDSAGHAQALISTWNGTSWTDQEVGAALNIGGAYVSSVSCVSISFCEAGGDYIDSASHYQVFISTWNGTSWTDQEVGAALNIGGNANIYALSCASATICVAGGYYHDGSGQYQAFTSTWNGTSWTDREIGGALNTGGYGYVNSVSCVSATFCVAGGLAHDSLSHYLAFVSTWNGTNWTDQEIAAALNTGGNADIYSLSCVSATFCVTGGYYHDGSGHYQAFTSTWNGTSWTDQEVGATLNIGGNAKVFSIFCTSASFCVAGGEYQDSATHYQALVSTWNGTSWTDQEVGATLNTGGNAALYSLSCVSTTFCVGGGYYFDGSGHYQSLVSTWNGTSWTDQEVGAAFDIGGYSYLNSMKCVGGELCVGGGGYEDSASHSHAFTSTLIFAAQDPLRITNSVKGNAGTPINLTTSGGSGTIAPTFKVTGKGCSLAANKLRAGGADTCVVVATNAPTGFYEVATSSPITFHFSLVKQRTLRVKALRRVYVGRRILLRVTGGSGRGHLNFHVTGSGCVLHARSLTSTRATRCKLRAHKNASGKYRAATSRTIVVTFVKKTR